MSSLAEKTGGLSASLPALSLKRARWVLPDSDLGTIERIARRFDLPEAIARLLTVRGIKEEGVACYLSPTLKTDFPNPLSMAGMDGFAKYLCEAVSAKRRISIFADFDVDGATSAAVLYRFLRHAGIEAPVYIPERLTEGYGPNIQALQKLKDEGTEIVILLDCGTTAFEPIAYARSIGLEVAVIDHHEAEDVLPDAMHIVNPKRRDDTSGLSVLAACGVTFMACVATNARLRETAFYAANGTGEAPLKDMLDLVALGTVCDMVPLTGVNRLLVKAGFERMQKTHNPGLKALIEVSGIQGALNPYHAGFILGPRINAGSRVHKSDLGARLLSTDDPGEAKNISWTLNDCNDKRKAIQADMESHAMRMVEDQALHEKPVIIVGHEDWHSGLSGLVAGRLKEKYGRPACVITYVRNENGDMEARGSGRSVPGVHIAKAFIDARAAGLIEKGGGHAMAGGFTLQASGVDAFSAFIMDHVAKQTLSTDANIETRIDGVLSVRGATLPLARTLQDHIGPFGQENSEPVFLFPSVKIHGADVIGGSHIRLRITDAEGGSWVKAMAFRAVGTEMGDAFLKQGSRFFDLLATLKINTWNGQDTVEMHIQDADFTK